MDENGGNFFFGKNVIDYCVCFQGHFYNLLFPICQLVMYAFDVR